VAPSAGAPPETASTPAEPLTEISPAGPSAEKPIVPESAQAQLQDLKTPDAPARRITVDTPLFTAVLSTQGADFISFVLKQYRESVEPDSPNLEMVPQDVLSGTVLTGVAGDSIAGLVEAVYVSDFDKDELRVTDQPRELTFSWTSPQGLVVEKHFRFIPDDYRIDLRVDLKNGSGQVFKDSLFLSILTPHTKNTRAVGFEGPAALINGSLEQVDIDDIDEKNTFSGIIDWIALQSRYFMAAVIPGEAIEATMKIFVRENDLLEARYVYPPREVGPGGSLNFGQKIFIGPKSVKLLSGYGSGLSKAVDFGWFDIVAKPGVYILNFIYGFIPNYGIAIIILTILTKILLWPLGQKSYKSMAEMKRLQPLIADLRTKYANDKKKMNEETMNLYRTYKVNPMGGCLPMVVQIPIFIALYRMLYETIELRHAPFFGWINDLSAPDRLFRFGFSIPFMEPPYGIPVLTIIMGATMFLQQKMSPPMGDATQAKMMMLMPVIFTVIFINFSSGLVLYWLVNNIFSIGQQYYTTKKNA
jgi:YidC/Oxa1 family membrane protein insertase